MKTDSKIEAGDDLDLVRLMDQIRNDAAQRKRDAFKNGASTFYRQLITLGIQGLPSAIPPADLKLQPDLEKRDRYHVNDLLGFHDEAFVKNAYRAILKREPDDAGLVGYLQQLRSGRYSKIDIVWSLKFSSEGEAANVPIEGLGTFGALRKLYRVPIVGYLLRLVVAIFRLPVLITHHRQLEAHTTGQLERVSSHFNEAIANLAEASRRQAEGSSKHIADLKELRELVSLQIDSLVSERQGLAQAKANWEAELDQRIQQRLVEYEIRSTADDHLLDSLCYSLEESLRGAPEAVKEEVKVYLPILKDAGVTSEILDVGCGRGEWLEVLREHGFQAQGVDNNPIVIERSRSLSLDIIEAEALSYLGSLANNSLSAVTAFHFVEHLPLKILIKFFDEAARVLKPDGLLILETPNPENLLVGSCNFYLDPTHKHPIPMPTMKLLLEARGFHVQDMMKLHPVKDVQIEVKDQLTSHLNHFLYGPMDYAVVARN